MMTTCKDQHAKNRRPVERLATATNQRDQHNARSDQIAYMIPTGIVFSV
jgi:hypothetical protein